MPKVHKIVSEAVRAVIESLEDRRLLASASMSFDFKGDDPQHPGERPHVDVVLTTSIASQITADHFSLINLSNDGNGVPVWKDGSISDAATAAFKPVGSGPLANGWYESYVRTDFLDEQEYEHSFSFLNADFDGSGGVNFADYVALQGGYGIASGAKFSQGDANYDGQVNFADMVALQANFGQTRPDLPNTAGGIAVSKISGDALEVGWEPVDEPRSGFKVYRSDDGGLTYPLIDTVRQADARTWVDDGTRRAFLEPDTKYWYRVRAFETVDGVDRVSASVSRASGTLAVGQPIAVAVPNPVAGTATQLSVLGGPDPLASTYTWAKVSGPGDVTFGGTPGTNAAKLVTASFSEAGTYTFKVSATDADNHTAVSPPLTVVVEQTATALEVLPANVVLPLNGQMGYTAYLTDQFGDPMPTPSVAWDVASGTGSVYGSTYYAAGTEGTAVVRATRGTIVGTAGVSVENAAPLLSGQDYYTTGGTAVGLSVTATDDGTAGLSYAWGVVETPDGGTASFGNANTASPTATFTKAGYYEVRVIANDGSRTGSMTIGIHVGQTVSDLAISPEEITVEVGGTHQFEATVTDQFGDDIDDAALDWTAGNGTINPDGLYSATAEWGYDYVVAASGGRQASASIYYTLPAPSGLSATAANRNEVNLTWTDNSIGETGFVIEQAISDRLDIQPSYSQVATVPPNATGWSIKGLDGEKEYLFRIRAANGGFTAAYSNEAKVTTEAVPPAVVVTRSKEGLFYLGNESATLTVSNLVVGQRYVFYVNPGMGGTWDGDYSGSEGWGRDRMTVSHNGTVLVDKTFSNMGLSDTWEKEDWDKLTLNLTATHSSKTFTFQSHLTMGDVSQYIEQRPWLDEYFYPAVSVGLTDAQTIPVVSIGPADAEDSDDSTPSSAWEVPLGEDHDDKLTFKVERSGNEDDGDFDDALAVFFHPPAGYAVYGEDYNGFGNVTIPADEAFTLLTLTATPDGKPDPDETAELILKATAEYRLGSYTSGGTISDVTGNIGFNNDNGPASDPGNKLLPGTPDAGFIIDADDDKTEDQGDGFRFWRDTEGGDIFSLNSIDNFAPFVVDVPNVPVNAGSFWLTISGFSPTAFDTVYVLNNPGASRLDYLSDPQTAQSVVQQSALEFVADGQELQLVDSDGSSIQAGHHEFLVRSFRPSPLESGTAQLTFNLVFKAASTNTTVSLDSAKVTFDDPKNFYSVLSSRDKNLKVPFVYPTENGRTENVQAYHYTIARNKRNPDVKKTAVFLHGYNVSAAAAEETFATTYQRMFWQGFRGNFVGWDWDGQQTLDPVMFNTDVENALHTSPALWSALHNRMQAPTADGGWGLGPQDIDLVAHSLGNVVMWDALRINAAKTPEKLVNNVTSIEAAIFQEAFDPVGHLSYSAPFSGLAGGRTYWVNESVSQQQQSGWRSWFNPSGRNIKSSVAGKIINSYNPDDSALEKMRLNEYTKLSASEFQAAADRQLLHNTPPVNRSSTNLNRLRTYVAPSSFIQWDTDTRKWDFKYTDLNRAIGTMANPIADVNIDGIVYDWRQGRHSDFNEREYPRIWNWWHKVIAVEQAVASGVQ